MPGFIGFPELLLLGVVVLLVFGPKRLPEMGRSMGRGLREFKASISGDKPDEALFDVDTLGDEAKLARLELEPEREKVA
jgi:sec-independent protein translocase protein TatA